MVLNRWFVSLLWIASTGLVFGAVGPARDVDPDEESLRKAGLRTDNESLLKLLRARSTAEGIQREIARLIEQLGADDFAKREEASRQLVRVGRDALAQLRKHEDSRDLEVRKRIRECLGLLAKLQGIDTTLLAIRVLSNRKAPGTVEALLAYLPYTKNPIVEEDIYYCLDDLAVPTGNVSSALVAALTDKEPARRAVAGCIIGRVGTNEQRAAAKKLLANDPDPKVRLRSAQGFLAATNKEVAAIPALIALLAEPSVEIGWQAEELLYWVAGTTAPKVAIGLAMPMERKRCRDAWQGWWVRSKASLDLQRLNDGWTRPGLVLVREGIVTNGTDAVSAFRVYGTDGRARFELPFRLHGYVATDWLPNGKLLTIEHSPNGVATCLREVNGQVTWKVNDVWPLAWRWQDDQHVLFVSPGNRDQPTRVEEIDEKGRITATQALNTSVQRIEKSANSVKPAIHSAQAPNPFVNFRGPSLYDIRRSIRFDDAGRLFALSQQASVNDRTSAFEFVELDTVAARPGSGRPVPGLFAEDRNITIRLGIGTRDRMLVQWEKRTEAYPSDRVHYIESDTRGQRKNLKLPLISVRRHLRNGNSLARGWSLEPDLRVVELDKKYNPVWESFLAGGAYDVYGVYPLIRFGFTRPETTPRMNIDMAPYRLAELKSGEIDRRRRALERLAALPAANAIWEAGRSSLRDLDPRVRQLAVQIVATYPPRSREAVPELVSMIRDKDANVRRWMSFHLQRLHEDARPTLLSMARDPRQPKEIRVACGYGLLPHLKSKDPHVVGDVKWALLNGKPEDQDWLLGGLSVYRTAPQGYSQCFPIAGANALIEVAMELITCPTPDVSLEAGRFIGACVAEAPLTVPRLLSFMQRKEGRVGSAWALRQLRPRDKQVIRAAIAELGKEDGHVEGRLALLELLSYANEGSSGKCVRGA